MKLRAASRVARIAPALVAAAAVALLATGSGAGSSTTPITTCGQVVTTNAVLTQDLTCPGSSGVIVGAAGITIDLKGFTLTGDRSPNHYGVLDGSFSRIKIENGVVRNFYDGVDAGSSAVTVSNVVASGSVLAGIFICCASTSSSISSSTASGNGGDGINVGGASVRIHSTNASGNAGHGIEVGGGFASIRSSTASGNGGNGIYATGDNASITSSAASGNGNSGIVVVGNSARIKSAAASGNAGIGIAVQGDSASIASSSASGNGNTGIGVAGSSAAIKGNLTDANGFPAGVSDGAGPGIGVVGYTVAPAGTNVAHGNDDPSECTPALLC
jgi:hypothetical protein